MIRRQRDGSENVSQVSMADHRLRGWLISIGSTEHRVMMRKASHHFKHRLHELLSLLFTYIKLEFHGSSFPRSILEASSWLPREDVANKSRANQACRTCPFTAKLLRTFNTFLYLEIRLFWNLFVLWRTIFNMLKTFTFCGEKRFLVFFIFASQKLTADR